MDCLEYKEWRNFSKVIEKAKAACENSKNSINEHFVEVTKTITMPKTAIKEITDFKLSRYACYLIFQNGDPRKLEEYAENKKCLKKERKELDKPSEIAKPSKEEALAKVRNVYDLIKNPDVDPEIKGNVMRDLVECIVYDKENRRLIFHLYLS